MIALEMVGPMKEEPWPTRKETNDGVVSGARGHAWFEPRERVRGWNVSTYVEEGEEEEFFASRCDFGNLLMPFNSLRLV